MVAPAGETHTTRVFGAGALSFVVETSDAEDCRLIESVFRDMPVTTDAVDPAAFGMRRLVGASDTEPRWDITGPYVLEHPTTLIEDALGRIMSAVNILALDHEPGLLHLHAAAASRDGRAVIVAAERNTGKTTTVAHLLARGWRYLTDEAIGLDPHDPEVTGLLKPLSIKPGGERFLEHLRPWMVPDTQVIEAVAGFRYVPVSAAGIELAARALPQLVVLLQRPSPFEPSDDAIVRPLHPVDAVVALMQETLDAQRFGEAAELLANLAANNHCFQVTTGAPEQTADAIEQLFALPPVTPFTVDVLPPSPNYASGVVSIEIGDRAVVHERESGRIFALDVGATRVWRQLGGFSVDEPVDIDAPSIVPFVARLRALGVLRGVA